MKVNYLPYLLSLIFFSVSPSHAQPIQVDSFDQFVLKVMKDFELPGLSVSIVRHDSVLYCKGLGLTSIEGKQMVDENTLFGIGSISKSFVALTLALLVDEGKIHWDDRVRKYLPDFELYDPYVTEHFTIRDLLTHRSGLKEVSGGTLWYHSDLSRTDIIKRLKYLKPETDFRTGHAYQNVMYMVAGEVVGAVTGMTWDDFLRTEVFDRLGMQHSTSVAAVRERSGNLAQPHIWNENFQRTRIVQEKLDNMAGAAAVYSSSLEMSKYMRLLLNKGVWGKDTIIHGAVLKELFKPQIHFRLFGEPIHNAFTSYGLGWWLTPYKGHTIIEHSGGIDGMSADLVMVEDLDIGLFVGTNTDEMAAFAITLKFLEMITGDASFNIYNDLLSWRSYGIESVKAKKNEFALSRIPGTKPSLDLEGYAGVYSDKMYGDIIVSKQSSGELKIAFSHTPVFSGKLIHWQNNTFQVDWSDIRIPDGFITFNFNTAREITGFSMEQENLLDVDFSELEIWKKKP